jgi:hypothetical protein
MLNIHDLGVFQVFSKGPTEIGRLIQGGGLLVGKKEDGF